jgi:hypothetical protein
VLDGRIEITIHLMSITLLKKEFRLLETGRILHLLFPLSPFPFPLSPFRTQ